MVYSLLRGSNGHPGHRAPGSGFQMLPDYISAEARSALDVVCSSVMLESLNSGYFI